ncbi:MAG: hypothetical protein QQN55_08940, partial [Nitrosopumilus sp.]
MAYYLSGGYVTKAMINGKIINYDLCTEESKYTPQIGFEFIGRGTIYSAGGVLQAGNQLHSFFIKSEEEDVMTKKYRLEINYSEITEENIKVVSNLVSQKMNGEICTYYEDKEVFIFDNGKDWQLKKVFSMLTEIKEPLARKEPESFESWRKKYKG